MRLNLHNQQLFRIVIVLGIFVWASFFSFSLLQPHQVMAAADSQATPANPEELAPLHGNKQPEQAPAQNWQYKQGLLTARGGLSSGGASGSLSIANQAPDWLWDLRLDSGLLNGEFGVNLSAAGGWSPTGAYGAWFKLSGEFSSQAWEHFQALLNLGWRPVDKLSLLVTLDYLQKRTEVEAWDQAEYLSQYGLGLETAYQVTPSISLSGLFMHYDTQGKKFGKIGEYEYTDDNNWYHYGHIFGGVRGGQYNELGVEANYAHPSGAFLIGLGLSQVWRTYEEMLGHAERDEDNGAGNASLTLPNLMGSGLNFNAAYRQEFATDKRQSWQVGAYRMFGPVSLGIYYQELSNDLTATDRRLYASLSLPLGAAPQDQAEAPAERSRALENKKTEQVLADPNLIRQMAGLNPGNDGQKQNSKAAWLRNPVKGMGTPNLRVAQQVEQRIDQTKVDMDGMPEGTTVEGNIMTLNGFPALEKIESDGTTDSAEAAFSIGDGGTTVKVELSKLPAPEKIWASFKQKDGKYSVVYLETQKGSIVTTTGGKEISVPGWMWESVWGLFGDGYSYEQKRAILDAISKQRPKVSLIGPGVVYVNDQDSYFIDVQFPPILLEVWKLYKSIHPGVDKKHPWSTSWITPYATGDKAVASFSTVGWHQVQAVVNFEGLFPDVKKTKDVYAKERPQEDEEESGGGAPAPAACSLPGSWRLMGGGMDYIVVFDAAGTVTFFGGAAGGPTPYANPTAGGITGNTTSLAGSRISGTVNSQNPGADNFVHIIDLTCNGTTMSGTITASMNGGPPTNYNVSGSKL